MILIILGAGLLLSIAKAMGIILTGVSWGWLIAVVALALLGRVAYLAFRTAFLFGPK